MTSEAPQDVAALRELAEKGQEQIDWGNEWQRWSGDALSDFELAASPDVVLGLLDQNDRLRSALRAVEVIHAETSGQGFTATGYGSIDPCCTVCGVDDEYAVPWPCPTVLAVRSVLRGSGAEEAARDD